MSADLIGNRTVGDLLLERVARTPDKQWLVFEDADGKATRLTYEQFEDLVARTAGGFASAGVGRGDKVALHLDNGVEMVVALFALAYLGAVAVPSNTSNQVRELAHVVGWSQASTIVSGDNYRDLVDETVAVLGTPMRRICVGTDPARLGETAFGELASARRIDPLRLHNEEPLEIIFTSGTTASPRGVVITHANWLWSGERTSRGLHVSEEDTFFSCLPLFHVNAQSLSMLNALTANGTFVLVPRFSASSFMDQVRRHGATHASIVAMMVRTLLAQEPSALDSVHSIRRATYALSVRDAERDAFQERFRINLINGYGLTETMTEVTVCPVFGPQRWPSIGLPAIGRTVRIIGEDGAEAAAGDPGEIVVHGQPGRTIMKEYYRDPAATAATVADGWLRTGDVGYLDEAGYLYFVDRVKDIVKRAGENISATEVEGVIAQHPAVELVAVVGVPDDIRDEAVKAFIVLRPGAAAMTFEEVRAHCLAQLAPFKVPTIVEFRDSLPMTSIGKIEKKLLKSGAAE